MPNRPDSTDLSADAGLPPSPPAHVPGCGPHAADEPSAAPASSCATIAAGPPAAAPGSAVSPRVARVASEDTRRLCVELARQAHDFHPGRDWLGVMPILQRIWLREPREIGWDDASALIHAAWMMRPR